MLGFERRREIRDLMTSGLVSLESEIDANQMTRLKKIRQCWNFYEGYHWEDIIGEHDTPELTVNYCRPFVDKFVSFELGKAFSFTISKEMENKKVNEEGKTLFEYLEDLWEDNSQYLFTTEMGQMKSITGEAWVQVRYYSPEELEDPYNQYPKGRIKISILPSSVVFPEFDPHDRDRLTALKIMYPYERITRSAILARPIRKEALYKQVWTSTQCAVHEDSKEEPVIMENPYGFIPFVQIKNLPVVGKTEGRGDLDDVIPLNTEYNLKKSNVSEIIDYHAAPVTVVYGAKIGNLEKGANKMWGGLAKDARIENLEVKGDLTLSSNYITDLKLSMCEIAGIPETVLGGAAAISNTSGVALQYMNLPLIEKTRLKRQCTEDGLERLNRMLIYISAIHEFISKPEDVSFTDFYKTEVSIPDTLPKDDLIELQLLQQELSMGLETRERALKRLGRENIEVLIKDIDEERKNHPDLFGQEQKINSGMTNGSTPIEEVRKEITGQNGGEQ